MNLKHFLLATALVSASASASAATYAIWPAATDGETQIPVELNYWWNFKSEEVTVGELNTTKCSSADGSNAASAGWLTTGAMEFDFSQLATLDLTFDARIDGAGQWNVRLTGGGVESDVTIAVPADGEFHKVRYNITDNWPGVAAKWAAGEANGKGTFTFALVGSNLNAESAIYFTNVRYSDAVPQPSLTAEVTDITSTSAKLTYSAVFPEGYTNTSVIVNGVAADGNDIILSGLTPKTQYTYTVAASGEYNGETFTVEKVVKFTTAREAGDIPVWYGTTEIEGFSAEYSITYNADGTLTVEATIETEKETPEADRNFHIFIGGDEWLKLRDNGSGVLAGTTTSKFEEGASITWEWYLPYAGGVYQEANTYVVGSENEAPLAIRVKASAQNITFESAEIAYEISCPAGKSYEVFYMAAGGEAIKAEASPIALTGLAERTEYTYEVYAVLTEGEQTIESRHATVSFKTPAADAYDHVYSDLFSTEVKNVFFPGEDESMRRSIFVTIPWSIIYYADGTAVYSADLSSISNIVGLVPQIYWNGFQPLTLNTATGRHEYHFGAQELEGGTAISHYFAYAGGVVDFRTAYTNWGMEKEAPVLGEAERLTLSASKSMVLVGEKVLLSAVATDSEGHYLPAGDAEYTVEGGAYTLEGSAITLIKEKGVRTVTATVDGLETSITITAFASAEATNLAYGLTGIVNPDMIQAGSIENVTDDNRESQLEWACGETEEHYFILDLCNGDDTSDGYYIEALDVYFEGAYASEFSVTLSSAAPAELGTNGTSSLSAATENVVFTNEKADTQHYFAQDPKGTHRYVTLRTTKALNTGWGIKLRDLKVYGTLSGPSSITTGVENVTVEDTDGAVEYYNLNGVRVENPAAGLYIRRQGNKVTKVLVK